MQGNTRGVPIDTDSTLSANSDGLVASQKATRAYFDSSNAIRKLATISGIDAKTTGQTTLYTVPTGKTCIITDIYIGYTAVNTLTAGPDFSIGLSPSYEDLIIGGYPLNGQAGDLAVNEYCNIFIINATVNGKAVFRKFTAGDVIKLDITAGATATTLTMEAIVFGHLY